MKIIFQQREIRTDSTRLADFLREQRIDPAQVIVELNGEVYGDGFAELPLKENDTLDAFRIVAGG